MSIPYEKMAVISTGHLTKEEGQHLGRAITTQSINGMIRPEGFLVYCVPAIDPTRNFENMNFILGFIKGDGSDWVLFDKEGDLIHELPQHDW